MTNLLHVADWLAWWGLVSLIAFFLFATFAHIVDLLFFPESDPEKPRQSAHPRFNRSGIPLQEGGVSSAPRRFVHISPRETISHPAPRQGETSRHSFAKGFDRRVS